MRFPFFFRRKAPAEKSAAVSAATANLPSAAMALAKVHPRRIREITDASEREYLVKLAKSARYKDRHPEMAIKEHYHTNRGFNGYPYKEQLRTSLQKHLSSTSGKIRVLDKGAGTGNFSASLKREMGLQGPRLEITTASLTNRIKPENRGAIQSKRLGIGLTMRHKQKYHVIIDYFGEDYRLTRNLFRKSVEKSLSLLEPGGDLFTLYPTIKVDGATEYMSYPEIEQLTDEFCMKDFQSKYTIFKTDFGPCALIQFHKP